jgi:hypothetical protein
MVGSGLRSQEPKPWTPRRTEDLLQSGEPVGEQAEGLRHECRRVPDLGLGLLAREHIEATGIRFPDDHTRRLVTLDDAPGRRGLLIWPVPKRLGILVDGDDVPGLEGNPGTNGKIDDRRDACQDNQKRGGSALVIVTHIRSLRPSGVSNASFTSSPTTRRSRRSRDGMKKLRGCSRFSFSPSASVHGFVTPIMIAPHRCRRPARPEPPAQADQLQSNAQR